jgi:hypothetical protein
MSFEIYEYKFLYFLFVAFALIGVPLIYYRMKRIKPGSEGAESEKTDTEHNAKVTKKVCVKASLLS